jgi:hypothetical protein
MGAMPSAVRMRALSTAASVGLVSTMGSSTRLRAIALAAPGIVIHADLHLVVELGQQVQRAHRRQHDHRQRHADEFADAKHGLGPVDRAAQVLVGDDEVDAPVVP